ncbi:hypothetical protein HZB02_05160 [Candidatus Woesearchaeota archaeon]|nr:hypothetical protein [Candidatus Woesearchaeota archaeon]
MQHGASSWYDPRLWRYLTFVNQAHTDLAGLLPLSTLIPDRDYPHSPESFASFGLFDPASWYRSPSFPEAFPRLLDHISGSSGVAVLEVKLLSEDQPTVMDWAHIEATRSFGHPSSVPSPVRKRAYHAYIQSRVPLSSYDHAYILPEIIVQTRIPLDRISMVACYEYVDLVRNLEFGRFPFPS